MEVICCGQVGVYEKQGIYQLNVRYIEPKGIGAQALALEQLKEKLKKEGLFDPERKKELPVLIQKIGIVTSPTGAAIKDILKVLDRRFSNLEIYISPTRVQGENAYKEIVEALNLLYRFKKIDLIIIARGGGSHEDLWSFNEEAVARKVSESPVPVISAVGHEIDVTICDLVADLRAATPSMAAELAVKEKSDYLNELLNLKQRIKFSLTNKVANVEIQLDQYLDRLKWVFTSNVEKVSADLQLLSGKLESLSPLKVLERGYSITYLLPDLRIITTTKSLSKGDEVLMKFKSGKAKGEIKKIID